MPGWRRLPCEGLSCQDFAIALVAAAVTGDAPVIFGTSRQFWPSRVLPLGRYGFLVARRLQQGEKLGRGHLGAGCDIFAVVDC